MTETSPAVDLFALLAEVHAEEAESAADKLTMSPIEWAAKWPQYASWEVELAAKAEAERLAAAKAVAPKCGRCRGTGHIPEFRHISGGDCFACDGSGLVGGNL